jgi:hypothetical protein
MLQIILLILESVMQVGEQYYFDTGLGLTCSSVPVVVRVMSRRPRNSVRSRVSGRIFPPLKSENFLLLCSVADPGSGAFFCLLDLGSGMGFFTDPKPIFLTISWVKSTKILCKLAQFFLPVKNYFFK